MENKTIEKIVKNNYDFVNKTKNYYQPKKEKNKKDCESIIKISQKMKN